MKNITQFDYCPPPFGPQRAFVLEDVILKKNRKFKVFFLLAIIVGIGLYPLASYRPEIFMAENQKLSSEFTKSYTGAPFSTLRVKCLKKPRYLLGSEPLEWNIELSTDGRPTVNAEGYVRSEMHRIDNDLRMVDVDDVCVAYRYVIKAQDIGYAVYTTGTEKKLPYSDKLVQAMLLAVAKANAAASMQADTDSTWRR